MRNNIHNIRNKGMLLFGFLFLILTFSSCDLALQKDYDYEPQTLDPHVNMTAWDYMQTRPDVFSSLIIALNYTGLDTYYKQTDKKYTFLTLNNVAMDTYRQATEGAEMDITKWDKDKLTKMLKYHIIDGEYSSYGQLPVEPIFVLNLLRGEEDGLMTILVRKNPWQADAGKIIINNTGSNGNSPMRSAKTSNIIPTNGVIHVFENYSYYKP